MSIVTTAELFETAYQSPNPDAVLASIRQFLAPLTLLNVSLPIAERFAEIRAYLRRQRQIISDFDIMLAATALQFNLTVLTFNRRHLERVPDLAIYEEPKAGDR
jgi:predicted nucleic acid-binding protein